MSRCGSRTRLDLRSLQGLKLCDQPESAAMSKCLPTMLVVATRLAAALPGAGAVRAVANQK